MFAKEPLLWASTLCWWQTQQLIIDDDTDDVGEVQWLLPHTAIISTLLFDLSGEFLEIFVLLI